MDKSASLRLFLQKYGEMVLAFLGFFVLFFTLSEYAIGGPRSTDVIWYMDVGINGIKDVFILNRYFHVFLQSFFLNVASNPLAGLQLYWAFLISSSCLLIYFIARSISNLSNPFHGFLAIIIFFSTGIISDTAGMPLVDVTAMVMVLLVVLVYLISLRRNHKSPALLIIIGILFYLGLRTKESTVTLAVLIFGLGYEDDSFKFRTLMTRMLLILGGFGLGLVVYAFLSWIVIGDPFFGLRWSEITGFFTTYFADSQSYGKFQGTDNWYNALLLESLWIPFIYYVVSGAKSPADIEEKMPFRLIWVVPLGSIIFVTASIGNQWGFGPRFIYPALPIICALGPQFLNFKKVSHESAKEILNRSFLFLLTMVVLIFSRYFIREMLISSGRDIASFLYVVYIPLLFSLLLGLVFLWKRTPIIISLIISAIMISLAYIPVSREITLAFVNRPNQEFSSRLFYPFIRFSESIHLAPEMNFLISKKVWSDLDVDSYVKDRKEIASILNVYFDYNSSKMDYEIPEGFEELEFLLLNNDYTNILLSGEDWAEINESDTLMSSLSEKYNVMVEDQYHLVFLEPVR